METRQTALMYKGVMYPSVIETDEKYHYFAESPFNLKDEIKLMRGSHWCGYDKPVPRRVWRIDRCQRNTFALSYLEAKNPYARWRLPLVDQDSNGFRLRTHRLNCFGELVKLFEVQGEMALFMLIRRQCIIAGEMGVGKTLAAFEAMELALVPQVWYAGPKSALTSVKIEALRWKLLANVRYMTYDELKSIVASWPAGSKPPQMVILDESSCLKTPGAQRTQVAQYLANCMRDAWGDKAYIILMTGTPAPKSPIDWYTQCEIACPGYLIEGDHYKFDNTLSINKRIEDTGGVTYNKRIAWRDGNPNTCGTVIDKKYNTMCGLPKDHPCHLPNAAIWGHEGHMFSPVDNQIERLYKRLKGLVLVKLKSECHDLPKKLYKVIKLKPSLDLIRAARLVMSQAKTVIESLTLQRELSDGFQYREVEIGRVPCDFCKGRKEIEVTEDSNSTETKKTPCTFCSGRGDKPKYERQTIEVDCPKYAALSDDLDLNEEHGRLVVYAGFTASIDRICKFVQKKGWDFIRLDGRGYNCSIDSTWNDIKCNQFFQDGDKSRKCVWVAHPASSGMGLTLTAACEGIYFSNDFSGQTRMQSEDRGHRPSMDLEKGWTIKDYILLPSDWKVRENLRVKKDMQSMTMGDIEKAMDTYDYSAEILV